jgi:hypothetical protein
MFSMATLRHRAAAYQARRRQLRTYMQISELPSSIRKDIGWPDGVRVNDWKPHVPAIACERHC